MAAKKKTTTNLKKDSFYRSPCPALNQIVLIRKLNSKEATTLYEHLKEFVKGLSGDGAVFSYIDKLTDELIIDKKSISLEDESSILVLKELYECIVDIYVAYRIELICADLNNIPMLPNPSDVFNFDWLNSIQRGIPNAPQSPVAPPNTPDGIDRLLDSLAMNPSEKKPPRRQKEKATFYNATDLKLLKDSLKKSVIGQDQAIDALINRLKLISVGFDKRGVFFFIGRTGVGKTELARVFGKRYCGNFAKINCAEFSHGHEVAKLIGAPPGYVGSSQGSFFKEKADVSNRWVFLFDEIEKANDKLFNLLLSLLDDGTITDSTGNLLDFSNSIFIFTSNQGISDIKETSLGFSSKGPSQESINTTLKDSLGKKFSPEFRNRIDEFIYFNDLTPENIAEIVKMNLKNYHVEITSELVDYVVKNAYSREYGVREIKRFIKNSIGLYVANAILDGNIPMTGTKYTLKIVNDQLELVNHVKISAKQGQII